MIIVKNETTTERRPGASRRTGKFIMSLNKGTYFRNLGYPENF